MDTLICEPQNVILIPSNERSERMVLQEQLRNLRNLYKQVGNLIAQSERRLAEIERAKVERERMEMMA